MISYTYDRGWGNEWPLKQLETSVVTQYLQPWINDGVPTAVINSTWFQGTDVEHIKHELSVHNVERVILISMLDPAIAMPEMFAPWPVSAVGYYPGDHSIDFWALFADQHMSIDDRVLRHSDIDTAYMCLNRKPHWHRRRLYQALSQKNLLDRGIVSMGSDHSAPIRRVDHWDQSNNLAPNGAADQHGIVNDIASLGDPVLWQRHFLNIVTETIFEIGSRAFVSEKIYKPILGLRPFLVYADDGAVAWLHQRGFESYVNDFSDITDVNLSDPDRIPEFLVTLCQQPVSYLQSKYLALKPKLLYNRDNFCKYVQSIRLKLNQGITCQI